MRNYVNCVKTFEVSSKSFADTRYAVARKLAHETPPGAGAASLGGRIDAPAVKIRLNPEPCLFPHTRGREWPGVGHRPAVGSEPSLTKTNSGFSHRAPSERSEVGYKQG